MKSMSISNNSGRQMSRALIEEFIIAYRNSPCLWKIKCREYLNKNLKIEAYAKLEEICRKEHHDAGRQFVVKKINSLRGSFRREYRRVITEENYVPQLWFYDMLQFTADQDCELNALGLNAYCFGEYNDVDTQDKTLKIETNNSDLTSEISQQTFSPAEQYGSAADLLQDQIVQEIAMNKNEEYNMEEESYGEQPAEIIESAHLVTTSLNDESVIEHDASDVKRKLSNSNRLHNKYSGENSKFRKFGKRPSIQKNMDTLTSKTSICDEYAAFGITVAAKLSKMDPHQRLYAENIINQTLFKGMLNQLAPPNDIFLYNPASGAIREIKTENCD